MINQLSNFKNLRLFLILTNDLLILSIALYISYFIRLENFINIFEILNVFYVSIILYIIIFFIFHISKQYFRYFNFNSYELYLKIYISYLFLFSFYVFFQDIDFIPRSLSLIFPTFFIISLIINRILISKILKSKFSFKKNKSIIFGFNSSNINILSSYTKILCFVDDNKKNNQRVINGVKILSSNEFNKSFNNFNFNQILIENISVFENSKYQIREHIISNGTLVQKISFKDNEIITSSYFDFNYFFNRKNKINSLGNLYKNKVILITGAGGSVGSNIVFQLLNTNYKKLILLDKSEFNLYNLVNSLPLSSKIQISLINFTDKVAINHLFLNSNIEVIFHAAAYKHVPLIETNPFSAIKNNFLDTYDFMKIVIKFQIPFFCLISSDKAVRPTNIMGASKRLSELALRYLDSHSKNKTILTTVRFGNVINSSGSVKPLFQYQIDNNLPLTLTHKKIIRYFMTIEEAANLVLNTYKISKGGEIFLLDMGNPIKLYDLAKLMIQFSGKTIKKNDKGDIKIKIIGLRSGEKLYEELLVDRKSKQSEIKSIYQSLESKMSDKEFKNLYFDIFETYKAFNTKNLIKKLDNKYINYHSKNGK